MRKLLTGISLLVVLVSAAPVRGQSSADWPSYNRTLSGHRFSTLGEINSANVSRLRKICSVDLPDGRAFQTGLIAIDGTIYATTDTGTFAIDGTSCEVKWRHDRPYTPSSFLGSNRGVAYLDGRLFRGAGDAHVYAIDAATGKTVWDVAIGDPTRGESVPMAPVAWNDMVFVGNAGGDNFGVTGRVYALSAKDGHTIWKYHTVPDTPEVMATWEKASPENPPTGGGVWTSASIDTGKGILYVAAGNPAPDFVKDLRPGKNLYTNSIIALDARTGKMLGYHQPVKDDFHDWDVSAAPALVITRGNRSVALVAAKDGMLHGVSLDAINMNHGSNAEREGILYSVPTTSRWNTQQSLSDRRDTRVCPGSQGGSEWNGAAYDPSLNLAIVPAVDWCTTVRLVPLDQLKGKPGTAWTGEIAGGFGKQDPTSQWKGWVTAFDADTGKQAWQVRMPTPMLAGVTPTAGGVTFAGDLDGNVYALQSRTGRRLWKGDAGQPIGGGIITFAAGGKQRLGVAAGMKSPIWPVNTTTARVVVFGLP
jgi:alcohol dehydrogenase (cytochrome c)